MVNGVHADGFGGNLRFCIVKCVLTGGNDIVLVSPHTSHFSSFSFWLSK